MSAARAVFIAGAGTEIGKTYVTTALTRLLRASDRPVLALKPLASGVAAPDDPAFSESDTAILLGAQGLAIGEANIAACSPWRFSAALAPDQAAAREGRAVALADLAAWCRGRIAEAAPETTVLIEGVGGLMSPITPDATGLDWLKALRLPALLVTGTHLGAISHALTAAETLRLHAVPLLAIVVSESLGAPAPPETVADAIRRRVSMPVVALARGGACPEALALLVRGAA